MGGVVCWSCNSFRLQCNTGILTSIQKKHEPKPYYPYHNRISSRSNNRLTSPCCMLVCKDVDVKYRLKRQPFLTYLARNENGNDDATTDAMEIIGRVAGKMTSVLQTPILWLGNIYFGFIIAVLLISLSIPIIQAGFNTLFFAILSYFGRKLVVQQMHDEDLQTMDNISQRETYLQIDFFAIISSVLVSALISPVSFQSDSLFSNILVFPLGFLLTIGLLITIATRTEEINDFERLTPDEKLMYQWDIKLEYEQTNANQTRNENKN